MSKLEQLIVNLENSKSKDENQAPTLSNVYEAILSTYGYQKLDEPVYSLLRKFIIAHLKELNNKEITVEIMFMRIFEDLQNNKH